MSEKLHNEIFRSFKISTNYKIGEVFLIRKYISSIYYNLLKILSLKISIILMFSSLANGFNSNCSMLFDKSTILTSNTNQFIESNNSSYYLESNSPDSKNKYKYEKLKTILKWTTLASGIALPWATAIAGGFSGSGGGSGVLSFKNPKDSILAKRYLNRNKQIPNKLLEKGKLQTLERWEMETNDIKPFTFNTNSNWKDILAKAKSHLRMVSPIIAERMDQLSDWMAFSEWDNREDLPLLRDINPNQNLQANDIPIQFAIRFSSGNNSRSYGPSKQKLKLKVLFNQRLFNLLEPLDQAMLVFHEELYALSQAVGHKTSDEIRPFVQFFFSEYLESQLPETHNGLRPVGLIPIMKSQLLNHFGDYAIFFSDIKIYNNTLPRTAKRHFSVFVEVINELRDLMELCRKSGSSQDQCAAQSLHSYSMQKDLSDEKSFVFINYFLLEKTLNIINSEKIMDSQLTPIEFEKILSENCKILLSQAHLIDPKNESMNKALRYCK